MADTVTCTEKMESREQTDGDNASARRLYHLTGSADELLVKAALRNTASVLLNNLVRRNYSVRPIFVDVGNPEGCVWEGEAEWGRRQRQPEMGESTYSFDTSGGTQHIMQSLETRQVKAAPALPGPPIVPAPKVRDYKGAINLTRNEQGEVTVDGLDIYVPVFAWSETHYLPDVFISPTYKKDLKSLSAKLNDRTWREYARGEVLFIGARGSGRSYQDWEMSFSFLAADNISNLDVGDITGIAKGAWDHVWFEYEPIDTGAPDHLKVIRARVARVERVYEYHDFSWLGLGI